MSLMRRLMQRRLASAPSSAPSSSSAALVFNEQGFREALRSTAPSSSSTPRLSPRVSCKAINAETGRQCALLSGHTSAHRHGRTDFWRVAEEGQTHFARRAALDAAGTARDGALSLNPSLSESL